MVTNNYKIDWYEAVQRGRAQKGVRGSGKTLLGKKDFGDRQMWT